MTRLLALIFSVFGLSALNAQTVPVQTGEHANFTRVVLTIPPAAEWRIGRVDAGYGILVDGAETYDIGGFFDIIPRTRIADATVSDAGALILALDCACRAVPFLDRPGILVVDIYNGPPEADAETEVALFPEPAPTVLPSAAETPIPALNLTRLPPTSTGISVTQPFPTIETLAVRAEENARVGSLEAEIAQSLTRAASQGLLELRDDLKPDALEGQNTDTAEMPEPPADQVQTPSLPGINARSSVDTALGDLLNARNITAELLSCWPDAHVAVPDWGTDAPFADQMAAARLPIFGEFDRVDPVAVETLARLYIFFGFGREAVQTLQIDGSLSSERAALVTLAEIIDGDTLTDNSILAQINCPNGVALWAVLATPETALPSTIDARRLALQFRNLPDGLQQHLRPRFATRLLNMAEVDLAETVISSGAPPTEKVETAIVTSDVAIEMGDRARAAQTLTALADETARITPDALIKLIDLQISEGMPIAAEHIADAQTMIFENRDLPIAAELVRAVIAGQLHNGLREAAWASLDDLGETLDPDQRDALEQAIVTAITTDGADATFVELIFDNTLESLPAETENLVATRLLALGFPERAAMVLRDPTQGAAMAERRYLRAEAAVMTGDFPLAEAHLAGITTERARDILSFGPDGLPLLPLAQNGGSDQSDTATTAWRNGDWSTLEQSDDPLLSAASEIVRNAPAAELTTDAPLASSRALVANASAARETVEALIDRFDAPLLAEGSP